MTYNGFKCPGLDLRAGQAGSNPHILANAATRTQCAYQSCLPVGRFATRAFFV